MLGLAAAITLAAIGAPLIVGTGNRAAPSALVEAPTAVASTPSPATSELGAFVAAAYGYGSPLRRDTVSAHFGGGPVGEWSRRIPATGPGNSFGGPITCLAISGSAAWLAGPATTATDGSTGRAAFIYLHDGGPDGKHDQAILWLSAPGQTLVTMTGWCENRFIPTGPNPVTIGDVEIHDVSH
jgi:hypothetical protein